MLRIVADLGNTRLKWARLDPNGVVEPFDSALVHDDDAWSRLPSGNAWAIASVNPPVAERLGRFLERRGIEDVRWYRSANDAPIRHTLATPETTGADRALAALAAVALKPAGRACQVVHCGTATVVERITETGIWVGGAIAPGLSVSAGALHELTAQLPRVSAPMAPPAWGDSTRSALEAGIYWSVVGGIREILTRQAVGLGSEPWVVWTGGDAEVLASVVIGEGARVVPDLVLRGLARVAFGARPAG